VEAVKSDVLGELARERQQLAQVWFFVDVAVDIPSQPPIAQCFLALVLAALAARLEMLMSTLHSICLTA
jgi:hypothetical protein